MSVAEHNQFLREVWAMEDRQNNCWVAQREAIRKGHAQSCKWVEVLGHQSAAHESWCDCHLKDKVERFSK